MKFKLWTSCSVLCLSGLLFVTNPVHAVEPTESEQSGVSSLIPSPGAPSASEESAPAAQPQRGKRRGEKETDGSQAPNRFESDPVVKSKYRVDGQPLEVDPD